MRKPVLSLYDFNILIKEVIEHTLNDTYLITAEIASLNVDAKGHAYIDLVQKDDKTITAKASARIWANAFKSISRGFEKATGQVLTKGLKVLVEAYVNFHERYGLSLIITNIDPTYTIGEMARKRREIIERLTNEGLIHKNKELEIPLVPKRIALVSSKKAAGFEDFHKHLSTNSEGYQFSIKLYDSVMQGDGAEDSILKAFNKIEQDRDAFDLVVIVRGGGAAFDLDCFDSYKLGKQVAFMSLPVISGIGHERDVTVLDETCNMRLKTPTAVASFLIDTVGNFEKRLNALSLDLVLSAKKLKEDREFQLKELSMKLFNTSTTVLTRRKFELGELKKKLSYSIPLIKRKSVELKYLTQQFNILSKNIILSEKSRFNDFFYRLKGSASKTIKKQELFLQSTHEKLNLIGPKKMLKMGYSITYYRGKVVKSVKELKAGKNVTLTLQDGEALLEVLEIRKGK